MAARFESLFLISRFQAELDRLFQEAMQIGDNDLPLGEWQPAIDVVETAAAILILAELPGFCAADLRVEVRGTKIQISGTKSTVLPDAQRLKFHCLERGHGRFSREIHVFAPVNTHNGTARLADGLLTLELPKIQDKRQEARVLHIEEAEESKDD
ncbi:MAG TPA: Hsp20/alpha crystallin family protein [Thermoanaerobaculia bacterium]|jgi:HSP20 family protein|nr:Hsp20/alpha crystallin family protein [Thermoanaerobaculia bacterium]